MKTMMKTMMMKMMKMIPHCKFASSYIFLPALQWVSVIKPRRSKRVTSKDDSRMLLLRWLCYLFAMLLLLVWSLG